MSFGGVYTCECCRRPLSAVHSLLLSVTYTSSSAPSDLHRTGLVQQNVNCGDADSC